MTRKLGEIAEISTGLPHRRYENEDGKEYKMLNLRSIKNTTINKNELDTFKTEEEINTKYLTRKGDVLVGLFSPYPILFITEENENIIVPQVFAILRTTEISNEYLYYYLNTDKAQHELQKRSSGSTIEKISIRNLKEIPIQTITPEKEEEHIKILNILNKRITLKTKELELLKEIQSYYLNQTGE